MGLVGDLQGQWEMQLYCFKKIQNKTKIQQCVFKILAQLVMMTRMVWNWPIKDCCLWFLKQDSFQVWLNKDLEETMVERGETTRNIFAYDVMQTGSRSFMVNPTPPPHPYPPQKLHGDSSPSPGLFLSGSTWGYHISLPNSRVSLLHAPQRNPSHLIPGNLNSTTEHWEHLPEALAEFSVPCRCDWRRTLAIVTTQFRAVGLFWSVWCQKRSTVR